MREANSAPLRAAGISADDVIGRPFWDTYWCSRDERLKQWVREASAPVRTRRRTQWAAQHANARRAQRWPGGRQHDAGARHGGFALHHTGTMDHNGRHVTVLVLPGSGTGQLAGISGTFSIEQHDGRHEYVLDYKLPGAAVSP